MVIPANQLREGMTILMPFHGDVTDILRYRVLDVSLNADGDVRAFLEGWGESYFCGSLSITVESSQLL